MAAQPREQIPAKDSAMFHISTPTNESSPLLPQPTEFKVVSSSAMTSQVSQSPPIVAQKLSTTTQYGSVIDMPSTDTNQLPSNFGVASTNGSNNNNTDFPNPGGVDSHNNVRLSVEFKCHFSYLALILMLILIIVFNHVTTILTFLFMFIDFFYFNQFVKRQVALRSKRSIGFLLWGIFFISMILVDHYYISYDSFYLYFGLIFIPPHSQPLSITSMLCSTVLGDYALKLTTMLFKMIVAIMSTSVLPIMKRGKVYLFIEATSQLLRCCVPILAWSTFILNKSGSYQVFGIFFMITYNVLKFFDVLYRLKLWWKASCNLFSNIDFKSVPSKEMLTKVGYSCPICYQTFVSPVMLQCNHIFCDSCITTWLDCDQTCPLCREKIAEYSTWCDGSTTRFVQFL